MRIEPKYKNWETAPLEFYKFLKWAIWLNLVYTVIDCYNALQAFSNYRGNSLVTAYCAFVLISNIVLVVFLYKAAVGLRNREWAGVKALYIGYIIIIVSGLIAMFFFYVDSSLVINTIASAVIFILIKIYFDKRRLLFYPYAADFENQEGTGYDIEIPSPVVPVPNTSVREPMHKTERLSENNKEIKEARIYYEEDVADSQEPIEKVSNIDEAYSQESVGYDEKSKKDYISQIASDEPQAFNDDVEAKTKDEASSDGIMFCYKCGHKINSDAMFCEKCGARLR